MHNNFNCLIKHFNVSLSLLFLSFCNLFLERISMYEIIFITTAIRVVKLINCTSLEEVVFCLLSAVLIVGKISTEDYMA